MTRRIGNGLSRRIGNGESAMSSWRWLLLLVVFVTAIAAGQASAQAAVSPALSGSLSDSATLPGATAVAISGHYAYVTDYYAGRLSAIDFSNPAAPAIAGSSPPLNELLNASTVNISGGYAFVASKNRNGPLGSESNDDGTGNSLTILDISSNPASPAIVGSIRDANTLFGAYGVAVSGNYAFVASQGCLSGQPCPNHSVGSAFAVIDITNPAAPTIVAALHNTSLPSPWAGSGALGHACSVAISGSYAYVTAAYQNRLTAISIANPLHPQIVASLKDTTNLKSPVDVAVSGKYAYVVDQINPGRLTVLDITNPAAPHVVTSIENTALNGAYRIRLHGDFAYVSSSSYAGVAVVDISNPLSPRIVAGVQSTAHLSKTTGLDVDPVGGYLVASSPFLSTQSQPIYPPYALMPEGPTLTGTVSTILLDPQPIAANIAPESQPANPTAQTGASFAFTANDAVSAMQCHLDGGAWGPCSTPTSQAYSGLGGGSHTFEAQATDAVGNTSTAAYTWTVVPPENTEPPTIAGQASVGQTLSASTGAWTGSPSLSYQWLRCDSLGLSCLPIEGASSASYSPVGADAGSALAVQVSATTSAGSSSARSSLTSLVTAAPADTSPPTIAGNATEGETLSASPGSWSGYPAPQFSYQWERCNQNGENCAPIEGASSSSYKLEAADVAATIVVSVQATNSIASAQASSSASAVITAAPAVPANISPPTISGSAIEGQALSASPGSWSGYPAPQFSYQWERCNGLLCEAIAGASASSYTVLSADVGDTLTVTVSASNTAGSAQASSATTAVVESAPGPLTPMLDEFARPDNSGPPGPSWKHMVALSSSTTNNLYITSQQVTGRSGGNSDYWYTQTFGPNSEAWVTVAAKPNIDLDPVVLGLRFQNPSSSTAAGYEGYYIYRTSQRDEYKIIRRTSASAATTLASRSGPTLSPGDRLLFRAIGTTLELWREDGGAWTRLLSTTDTTYQGAGYLHLAARNSTVRLASFGGGTLP